MSTSTATVASFPPMDADLLRSGLVATDLDATPYPGNGFTQQVGYTIPYYNLDGTMHPIMRRWRFTPALNGSRYGQPSTQDIVAAKYPPTDATHPYLNPKVLGGMTWEKLAQYPGPVTWTIVEGEKKAVCAAKELRKPFIGIGGCNNALVTTDGGWRELHPVLRKLFRSGDYVEIVFDGDLLSNEQVNYAAGTLRRVLLSMSIGVTFVILPKSQGLDDWLMALPQPTRQSQYPLLPRYDGREFLEHSLTLGRSLGLRFDEKSQIKIDEENIYRILAKHERYTGKLWFDCVKGRMYEKVTNGAPQPVSDAFAFNEGVWMQRIFRVRPNMTQNSIFALESRPGFHRNPVREYLESLQWDGVQRLPTMLTDGWGVANTPYHQIVAQNFLVSLVARAFSPGCQVDCMYIFEGKQGIYKSKALEILGGEWYVAVSESMEHKDFKLVCHTGWLVDVVELGSFKYSDFTIIKGVITGRTDSFRPPYGRASLDVPRRFVLSGTVNDDVYLRDTTGNRRFVPISCGTNTINIDWIRINRDQLFAEAVNLFRQGYQWWTDPPGIFDMQAARVIYDPWEAHVDAILADELKKPPLGKTRKMHFIPAVNILTALGLTKAQQTSGQFSRLRAIMDSRRDWEKYLYVDKSVPIPIADGTGNIIKVTSCRGYMKLADEAPPPTTIYPVTGTFGGATEGSKF